MQRSTTYTDNLSKLGHNSIYLEQLNELQFKMDIDLEELPNDDALESPNYCPQDFINIQQMILLNKSEKK